MTARKKTQLSQRISQRDRARRMVAVVSATISGTAVLATGALVFALDHHAGASTSSSAPTPSTGQQYSPGVVPQNPYGQGYNGGYGSPSSGGGYGYPSQGNGGGGYVTAGS
jgi:hypothetical protein